MECTEQGCDETATVLLHIPWADNSPVCAGHARVISRKEGVVAEPLESSEDELPEGASNR